MTRVNRLKNIHYRNAANEEITYIEAFLFCPNLGKHKKESEFIQFFTTFATLDEQIEDCVVFLNLASALHYSRFMSVDHLVLRVFISQAAIEGHHHKLGIKKGFLLKQQIHGCYPGWGKGTIYVENPIFASNYSQSYLRNPDLPHLANPHCDDINGCL